MGYMDDQKGKDYSVDEKKYDKSGLETTQTKHVENAVQDVGESMEKPAGKGSKGLLSKARDLLTGGGEHAAKSVKEGTSKWNSEGGLFSLKGLAKAMNPKKLAITAALGGTGVLSIFGLFSSYKNDDITKNDPPYECETGFVALPTQGSGENDIQENVNIMYDIYVNQMGYSEEFLVGLIASIMVESNVDPTRLESDFIMEGPHQAFLAVAGPEIATKSGPAYAAFQTYANAFKTQGGWNGSDGYFCGNAGCELCGGGQMTCGIGLIQWTGGRAHNLIKGLDKIDKDYSLTSIPYQCAFMMSEIYQDYPEKFDPDTGEWRSNCGDDVSATKFVFRWLIAGGGEGTGVSKRTDNAPMARQYVNNAAANSQFTRDTISMIELLSEDSVNVGSSNTQQSELCVNGTVIDPSSIAMAAVSMSWLEKGEYANEEEAYLMIRRSARSPVLINDWDYLEGKDGACNIPAEQHVSMDANGNITVNKDHGMHDLIACTEFYYYAHLIAYPKETGAGNNAGYFASCDRGAGTSVRIAGADDNYPAGNPDMQLSYMLGSQHNAKDNVLWEPTGFLRGCDYYDFGGATSIASSSIMCTWENAAANGLLTPDAEGNSVDGNAPSEYEELEAGEMSLMNLRFPLSKTTTHNHIIVAVGEGTVQSYWGMDFLYQQYRMFDDADSLIRGDLTIEAPEDMTDGLAYKAQTASASTDKETTFWMEENEAAQTYEDVSVSEITNRPTGFNPKTGLPTFMAWEQIFVRLIHNTDDDATYSGQAGGDDLFYSYDRDKDNYLDSQEDHIENYGEDPNSYTNKYFYQDWNYAGAGEVEGGGTGDYDAVDTGELLYYDDGSDVWTEDENGGAHVNKYWRYEYITDVEYRVNQIIRFGMAAGMCSYASEEDANIYQDGDKDGHIIGNIYRRNSRISDDIDGSGRYYYFNTVVSNDMLQDLTQLYAFEGNDPDYNGTHPDNNFGPIYQLSTKGYPNASGNTYTGDRRYGLTAADIEYIMGLELGGDGFNELMNKYVYTPMYEMNDAQLSLYDTDGGVSTAADNNGAHEGNHTPNPKDEVYTEDIYGLNPFLAIDQALGRDIESYVGNETDRSGIAAGEGTDSRMAYIDRHFWVNNVGNINMYAYMVMGMNPSTGNETGPDLGTYTSALKSTTTLNAISEYSNNGNAESLYSAYGELSYTDYIYGDGDTKEEATESNIDMARRLYGDDDRNGDGIRDDYNRREYIVIPYYHTHIQACDHDPDLENMSDFELECDWCNDDPTTSLDNEYTKLDSQVWLNEECDDYLTTIAFSDINMRGKYGSDYSALLGELPMHAAVIYYLDDGTQLNNAYEKPHMDNIPEEYWPESHKGCGGYTCSNPIPDDATDDEIAAMSSITCGFPGCGAEIEPGETGHHHSCDSCIDKGFAHGHVECMGGSECHDHYGCNPMEYYYHGGTDRSGETHAVYMVITVAQTPHEIWGSDIDIEDWMAPIGPNGEMRIIPDKANLLQAIPYDANGVITTTGEDFLNCMFNVRSCDVPLESPLLAGRDANYDGTTVACDRNTTMPLIGYFTIEGNVICDELPAYTAKFGETVFYDTPCCSGTDLRRVESIRARVNAGKTGGSPFVTGTEVVTYCRNHSDPGITGSGYGEVMVVGSQHKAPPTDDQGNYGGGIDGQGSGPDTCNGNETCDCVSNSLLRCILGNSHVFHIRYGTREPADASMGYDYTQYAEEFIELDEDKKYIDNYTGEVTTEEFDKYDEPNRELNDYHENGDYALWVAHSSRGDRGIKTAYWNVKGNCGDPYETGPLEGGSNMQYMIFANESAKDLEDVDHDGDREEPYIWYMGGQGGTLPSSATNTETGVVYGQSENSHWKRLIDLYNAAMSESRQFD